MKPLFRSVSVAILAFAATTRVGHAQAAPASPDTAQAVRVFVDCQNNGCDHQFFVDQMKWVDFVRDRLFADVTLLVTSLRTGSGGSQYTVSAIGGERYRGRADTVTVYNAPNDASDVIRRRLMRTFSLLLGPYAARTALAERLALTYTGPSGAPGAQRPIKDPWNFWVYRLSANGFGSGEKSQSFGSSFFNASASRVTAEWKTTFSSSLSYDQSKFNLSGGGTFSKIQRDYSANALLVRSIDDHWSAGATAQAQYSDFYNYDLNLKLQPAIEWNYYPYKEFTSRQLTALYTIGVTSARYQESTIYFKVKETHPLHTANLAWNVRQTWGSVNMSLFGSQYLHDRSYYSYGVSSFTDLRLTKGLSVNLGGNYSRVNDQLYLRRGTLSDNQVIARQQALATNFRYFLSFGVSYTFGSIFNTVVNPRFNSARSGGGGITISF